jgi:hypothetical protein
MATFNVVLVLCTLTTSMILESKSDPVPLLDTMKAPLVVDLDMTRVKSHIKGVMENEISNLTQSIQRMVDDGVQKKLAEMETRMNTFDTKLKSGKKNRYLSFLKYAVFVKPNIFTFM